MPRETLTRDEIVQAAIELLDREGLEGLNMRALGQRLGSAATAVYWHVGSKANLLVLAGDRVWDEAPPPEPGAADWRAGIGQAAQAVRAMLARHGWLMQAFGTVAMFGPAKARYDENSLALYEAAGFTSEEADLAAAAVFTFILGDALGAMARATMAKRISRGGAEAEAAMQARMAQAREIAERFPRLRARLETPSAGYAAGPDGAFEHGLQALLDGLEARRAAG